MRWNRETPVARVPRASLVALLLIAAVHMISLKVGGPMADLLGYLVIRTLNILAALVFLGCALYQLVHWMLDKLYGDE